MSYFECAPVVFAAPTCISSKGNSAPQQPSMIPGSSNCRRSCRQRSHERDFSSGTRVGVCWLGGTDGSCSYCKTRPGKSFCDSPVSLLTGYNVQGGYAEYAVARSLISSSRCPLGLTICMPPPLLCAGIIGFRSLRVAGVEAGERVGLFGFGASAHLAIAVLRAWKCEVYVSTRGKSHRDLAASLGAVWVGSETEKAASGT